jgi:hypothetical protein
MNTRPADGPFRLESVPCQLWDMARMTDELRADDQTIRRWVREGVLPPPSLRRGAGPTGLRPMSSRSDVGGSVASGPCKRRGRRGDDPDGLS